MGNDTKVGATKPPVAPKKAPAAPKKAPPAAPKYGPPAPKYGPARPAEHRVAAPAVAKMPAWTNLNNLLLPRGARPAVKAPTFPKNQARAARFDLPRTLGVGALSCHAPATPKPAPAPKAPATGRCPATTSCHAAPARPQGPVVGQGVRPKAPTGPVNHHADQVLHRQHQVHQWTGIFEVGEKGVELAKDGVKWLAPASRHVPRFERVVDFMHHNPVFHGAAKVVNVAAKVQGAVGILKGFEMAVDPRTSHSMAAKQLIGSGLSMLGPYGAAASFVIDKVGPSEEDEFKHRRAYLRDRGINFEGPPVHAEDPAQTRRMIEYSKQAWIKELKASGARPEEARKLVDEWADTNYRLNGGELRAGLLGTHPRRAVPNEEERRDIVARFQREVADH